MAQKRDTTYKAEDLRIMALRIGPKLSNEQLVSLPHEWLDEIVKPPPSNEELSRMLYWAANEVKRLSMTVRTMMGRMYAKKKEAGHGGT